MRKNNKGIIFMKKGFTLIEVLIAIGILVIVLVGLFQVFISCSQLASTAGNLTMAVSEAQDKIEEIRNHAYDLIATDYAAVGSPPANTFDLAELNGKGVVYIDSSNPDLLVIEVNICWREKDNRIIGEDTNLNGVLDVGENEDGDEQIDSIVKLVTLLAEK